MHGKQSAQQPQQRSQRPPPRGQRNQQGSRQQNFRSQQQEQRPPRRPPPPPHQPEHRRISEVEKIGFHFINEIVKMYRNDVPGGETRAVMFCGTRFYLCHEIRYHGDTASDKFFVRIAPPQEQQLQAQVADLQHTEVSPASDPSVAPVSDAPEVPQPQVVDEIPPPPTEEIPEDFEFSPDFDDLAEYYEESNRNQQC